VLVRNHKLGNRLGVLSILLAAVPLAFILVPGLPQDNLTGYIVLCGAGGALLLFAVGAGLIGSRRWLLALLGPAMVLALVLFNP
jgi:hypothetical protein